MAEAFEVPRDSAIVKEMQLIRERIADAQRIGSVVPILTYLYAAIAANTPSHLISEIACKAGCGWCCHTRVPATAPELLYLIGGNQGPIDPEMKVAIRRGADQRRSDAARAAGFVPHSCPILRGALCAEHPRRPVVCRTAVSLDAEACRHALDDPLRAIIPTDRKSIALRAAFDIALHGALLHAGYSPVRYELVTGLAGILEHPDPEHAWLNGDLVLDGALTVEEEEFFSSPLKKACYNAAFS